MQPPFIPSAPSSAPAPREDFHSNSDSPVPGGSFDAVLSAESQRNEPPSDTSAAETKSSDMADSSKNSNAASPKGEASSDAKSSENTSSQNRSSENASSKATSSESKSSDAKSSESRTSGKTGTPGKTGASSKTASASGKEGEGDAKPAPSANAKNASKNAATKAATASATPKETAGKGPAKNEKTSVVASAASKSSSKAPNKTASARDASAKSSAQNPKATSTDASTDGKKNLKTATRSAASDKTNTKSSKQFSATSAHSADAKSAARTASSASQSEGAHTTRRRRGAPPEATSSAANASKDAATKTREHAAAAATQSTTQKKSGNASASPASQHTTASAASERNVSTSSKNAGRAQTSASSVQATADGATAQDGGNQTGQNARHGRGHQQRGRYASQAARNQSAPPSTNAQATNTGPDGLKPLSSSIEGVTAETKPMPDSSFDAKILQATSEGTTSPFQTKKTSGGTGAPPFVDRARTLAWLRSTGRSSVYTRSNDGWKTLEMQLKNGDGLMTVSTRQGKDRMAVSVGFTDARMRAQAVASLNQLQEMLQSQYDTNVDFSLMGDGTNDAHQQAASDDSRGPVRAGVSSSDSAASGEDDSAPRRALAPGTQYEWIG